MRQRGFEIENIEEMRRRQGIDDVELRREIRGLQVGDWVNLTFLSGPTAVAGETLGVRITRIRGRAFRGKLAAQPASPGLADLPIGSPIAFTPAHIHSLQKRQPPMSIDVLTWNQRNLRGADSNSLLRLYDLANEVFAKSRLRQERERADKAIQRIARELAKRQVPLAPGRI